MATYAIGDVQGCLEQLQALLKHINYNPGCDHLWFCGDLVNRGPLSLETLRFIKALPNIQVVLGNHDLHLLAVGMGARKLTKKDTFEAVLTAPDKTELLDWIRQQPLLHHDASLGFTMVHAGLLPNWSLKQACSLAEEVHSVLRGKRCLALLTKMYGNKPKRWRPWLRGNKRLRIIINGMTRLRFCSEHGKMELDTKSQLGTQPAGFIPWFEVTRRKTKTDNILFGHWASLLGDVKTPQVFALDSGCVWGNTLTALRLEDKQRFSVPGWQKP